LHKKTTTEKGLGLVLFALATKREEGQTKHWEIMTFKSILLLVHRAKFVDRDMGLMYDMRRLAPSGNLLLALAI
jgi:hypothetical protein